MSVAQNQPTLNCNGKLLDLSIPRVMGILNLSPNSFYGNSSLTDDDKIIQRIDQFLTNGMDILDIGSASSKPKSLPLTANEELDILLPKLKLIRKAYPEILISIDTYHAKVIKACADFNINMVNDISGFQGGTELVEYLGTQSIPYVLMHKKGSTQSMQDNPSYENVTLNILNFLKNKIRILRKLGLKDIIIDPGFGFGKTIEHNFELLKKLSVFKILECPIMVGLSRKSMIYKTLETTPEQALNGTTALHLIALQNGAKILRAHDVLEAKECIRLHAQIQN